MSQPDLIIFDRYTLTWIHFIRIPLCSRGKAEVHWSLRGQWQGLTPREFHNSSKLYFYNGRETKKKEFHSLNKKINECRIQLREYLYDKILFLVLTTTESSLNNHNNYVLTHHNLRKDNGKLRQATRYFTPRPRTICTGDKHTIRLLKVISATETRCEKEICCLWLLWKLVVCCEVMEVFFFFWGGVVGDRIARRFGLFFIVYSEVTEIVYIFVAVEDCLAQKMGCLPF